MIFHNITISRNIPSRYPFFSTFLAIERVKSVQDFVSTLEKSSEKRAAQ